LLNVDKKVRWILRLKSRRETSDEKRKLFIFIYPHSLAELHHNKERDIEEKPSLA
jgi:hypothetical protein